MPMYSSRNHDRLHYQKKVPPGPLKDIRAGGPSISKLTLRNLCKEIGITNLPTTKWDLTDSIINANVPYDEFVTKFFKIGGRSGGVARGFCEHGIVYVIKLFTGPEGTADYFQMLKSLSNAPAESVIDFAPQVAKYISALEPSFLGPDGGERIYSERIYSENIQRVLDGCMLGFFFSLKKMPFNMIREICGIRPRLLCFDATQKVKFKIPNQNSPSEVVEKFSDYGDL